MGFEKYILPQYFKKRLRKKSIKTLYKNAIDTKQPKEVVAYLESYLSAQPLPVQESNYLVLDTETTGLDIRNAQLLSVGFLEITKGEKYGIVLLKSAKEYFIKNLSIEEKDAIAIHGIRNTDLKSKGDHIEKVLPKLLLVLKGKTLVAHHARFDAAILQKYLSQHYGIPLLNPIIDTAYIARKLDRKGLELPPLSDDKYKLDALCTAYNVEQTNRHTALGDAYATALLFLKLEKALIERKINLYEQTFYL